jgi:hypothetical protein
MAYGLIYTSEFDSFKGAACRLEIDKKDFVGTDTPIVCGGGATVLSWGPDDPKAAIRGASLDVELLNVQGTFPISNFYSIEDDTFKVRLYENNLLVFTGFLVQDDCSEIVDDFTHSLNISATDNLGLLKDISLDQAAFINRDIIINGTFAVTSGGGSYPVGLFIEALSTTDLLINGASITIDNGITPPYTVTVASYTFSAITGDYTIVVGTAQPSYTVLAASVEIYRQDDLRGRITFAELFKLLMRSTGLEINTKVFMTVFCVGGATGRTLEDVQIDPQTWLNNQSYEDCWQIIEDVLGRFRACLFQANGYWVILRPDEIREWNGQIVGFEYDADFVYVDAVTMPAPITIGTGSDIEAGLLSSIQRPLKFVREEFKYEFPEDTLCNGNLDEYGNFRTSYAEGLNTVTEYDLPGWEQGFDYTTGGNGYIGSSALRFMRIVRNSIGKVLESKLVIKGNSGFSNPTCAQSCPIEVRAGDRIQWGFEFKTNVSQPGQRDIPFVVEIITTVSPTPRSMNNKRLRFDGEWFSWMDPIPPNTSIYANINVGDNTNNWQNFSISSAEIPVNGILTVKIAQAVLGNSSSKETEYRNFSFEIIRSIAGVQNVIGHTHTQTQEPEIKNNNDIDIKIDDAPSSNIRGAMFLDTFTGPLQNLTTLWQRGIDGSGSGGDQFTLGQLITKDELFNRRKDRVKLDGNILLSNLTPLSVIQYTDMMDKYFIFGALEISHKLGETNGNLYEYYTDGEVLGDLISDYQFNYLYDTR